MRIRFCMHLRAWVGGLLFREGETYAAILMDAHVFGEIGSVPGCILTIGTLKELHLLMLSHMADEAQA